MNPQEKYIERRSHVVILTVPDEAAQDLAVLLDKLARHRGWEAKYTSFLCTRSAQLAGQSCHEALNRFDSVLTTPPAIPAAEYSDLNQNVSLLKVDGPDLPPWGPPVILGLAVPEESTAESAAESTANPAIATPATVANPNDGNDEETDGATESDTGADSKTDAITEEDNLWHAFWKL